MDTPLEDLANEFRLWRETRSSRSETPTHLKDKTRALLSQHSKTALVKKLGVSYDFLVRLQPEKTMSFVALPEVEDTPALRIRIAYPKTQLEVDGAPQQIAELVQALESVL